MDDWMGTFALRMENAGWEPTLDAFGSVYQWTHDRSGKVVNHTAVFAYWWMNYELPAHIYPFDKDLPEIAL